MSTNPDSTDPRRPPGGVVVAVLVCGAGVAIGVPWAVFRYGPNANLGAGSLWALALVGIGGGLAVMWRGLRS